MNQKTKSPKPSQKKHKIFFPIVIVILLILASIFKVSSLGLKDPEDLNLLSLLGTLIFIALIAERALEVFLTTWRGPDASAMDLNLKKLKKEQEKIKSENATKEKIEQKEDEFTKAEKERNDYRMTTRSLALWLGMLIGIFISFIGIRTLSELVNSFPHGDFQNIFFNIIDILLTGALIAGGSEGIHKIAEVYNNFMGSTAKKAASDDK